MTHWLNRTFETRDRTGAPNGRIIRVWEQDEAVLGYGVGQVYITTILPGMAKGPHLHRKRDSVFCCIQGAVVIRRGSDPLTAEYFLSAGDDPRAIHIPAGTASRIVSCSEIESLVVNVSSGRYDPADDEEVPDFA